MTPLWTLEGNAIRRGADTPFADSIEMAGHETAAIVTYGVDADGRLRLSRELCYPRLRTLPRDTFGTLHAMHGEEERQVFCVDGRPVEECPQEFTLAGLVCIRSQDRAGRLCILRWLFPCMERAGYLEHTVVENRTDRLLTVSTEGLHRTRWERGAQGIYTVEADCPAASARLAPGGALVSDLFFSARLHTQPAWHPDGGRELEGRRRFVKSIFEDALVLDCADQELAAFFRFAKLRAAESIFDTAAGPLHSPGGGPYYAAVWANDQAEYAGPFFPFLGYPRANEASANAYDLFARFMGPDMRPIPSSVIDEGRDFWEGAGDRGDAAMYLYGCARYLLALGDRQAAADRLWTLEWAARYCLSRRTADGVIASDHDELEGRLPAGDANLCTSSLAYGGLLSAAALAEELERPELAVSWRAAAAELREAIGRFFGAAVSGFDTYRYYEGNTQLRSWICMPLTVGIYDRQAGTADALLSPRLFQDDGLLSVEGDVTFWDRSTLYAFRGILNAGQSDRVYPFMRRYIAQRLLGAHVPYAVEAYPEGNQRHLSGESALFCRVVTEGLCGMTPVGLRRLELRPAVPECLGWIRLSGIRACGGCFDLELTRREGGHDVRAVHTDGRVFTAFVPAGEGVFLDI